MTVGFASLMAAAGQGGGGTTDFVLVVRTTAPAETFTLPLKSGYTYNANVDWGDGVVNTITSPTDANRIHTYALAGDHTISISGVFQALFFNFAGDKNKVIEVQNLGDVGWTGSGLSNAFAGCTNLAAFTVGNTDMSLVTQAQGVLRSTPALSVVNLTGLDTRTFTSFSYMFSNSASNPDISTFNISNIQSAIQMMASSGFSDANYDKMLLAWAAQEPNIKNLVNFHAGAAKYTESAARAVLATTHSWTITDGGPA